MPSLAPLLIIVFRIMLELYSGPYQGLVAYAPQAHELYDTMAASFHTATDLAYNGFTAWTFAAPALDSSYRIVGQDVLKYTTAPQALAVAAAASVPFQYSLTISGMPPVARSVRFLLVHRASSSIDFSTRFSGPPSSAPSTPPSSLRSSSTAPRSERRPSRDRFLDNIPQKITESSMRTRSSLPPMPSSSFPSPLRPESPSLRSTETLSNDSTADSMDWTTPLSPSPLLLCSRPPLPLLMTLLLLLPSLLPPSLPSSESSTPKSSRNFASSTSLNPSNLLPSSLLHPSHPPRSPLPSNSAPPWKSMKSSPLPFRMLPLPRSNPGPALIHSSPTSPRSSLSPNPSTKSSRRNFDSSTSHWKVKSRRRKLDSSGSPRLHQAEEEPKRPQTIEESQTEQIFPFDSDRQTLRQDSSSQGKERSDLRQKDQAQHADGTDEVRAKDVVQPAILLPNGLGPTRSRSQVRSNGSRSVSGSSVVFSSLTFFLNRYRHDPRHQHRDALPLIATLHPRLVSPSHSFPGLLRRFSRYHQSSRRLVGTSYRTSSSLFDCNLLKQHRQHRLPPTWIPTRLPSQLTQGSLSLSAILLMRS